MQIIEKIKNIPSKPGVYIMKNREGEIIYIGKAKNLNKRVSSYFQRKLAERKTEALVSHISSIETIITDNEIEALILESNLIKKHKPRFNIELKDNNKYPYIKITNDEYPQIVKTRIKKDDGSLYFGPYPNVKYINRTIKTVTDIFPIKRCSRQFGKGKTTSPCINYYMGKCVCPLQGKTDSREYRSLVDQVVLFLKGQNTQLLIHMKKEMEEAAAKRRYEKALLLRERYTALNNLLEDQKITTRDEEDEDIFGIAHTGDTYNVTILIRRDGKIVGKRDFVIGDRSGEEDVLGQFLSLYYADSTDPPKTILLPMTIGGKDTLKSYLKQKHGRAISIVIPQKGMKKRLVNLACKNAYQKIKEHLFKYNPQNAMLGLKKLLKLGHVPHLIEAFDVATLLGSFSVASMVRFTNALPDKKNYRRFKIKYVGEQNDVEMIKEAVARRYQRLLNEQKSLPDLILIDGGKPQVNAAFEILKELEIQEVPLIGLAKQHEEIYPHGEKKPILLEKGNEALRLLMAIRDEAHRFATTYHVKIRDKATIQSRLKGIPGIGDALVQKILASSVKLNGHTTIDALKQIPGIGVKKAREIWEALHTKDNNP